MLSVNAHLLEEDFLFFTDRISNSLVEKAKFTYTERRCRARN